MPLDPQLQALVDGMAANPDQKPIHEMSPAEARAAYLGLVGLFGPGEPVADVRDRRIPGPAGDIPIRVYRPDAPGPLGALVFFHGGGFVIGGLDSHDRECRALCNRAHCVVVAVDYRLAPEHPFPAAADDAFAALRWVADHAREIGADPARLAIGGDSAGGNLTAVTALRSRDAGGPPLRLQLMVYPAVDLRRDAGHPSLVENAAGPFLEKATMDWFIAQYLEGDAQRTDLRASPLLAKSHSGLPPALVVTAEFDPLRDEGEAYAEALRRAGVPVTLHRYDGMAHLFFQLSPVVDASGRLIEECASALRGALA